MKKLDISLLLVEDDTVIRNIYKQILGSFVSELHVAENGEEGYKSYLSKKPDLIITDIKMPVMNGLDMIRKIRELDKTMRIIIMSAYGESRFFINAIETGVKGFLIKPVDTDHLKNVISEQANDILLEKRVNSEENKRLKAEKERDRVETILRALLETTAIFLNRGVNDSSLNDTLAHVGQITDVSRTYIFKIHKFNGKDVLSQANEWVSEGVKAQINNPDLRLIPMDHEASIMFGERMKNKQNLSGFVEDFKEPLKSMLLEQDIKSMLAIPIYVKDTWWGFIGFDDCRVYRKWTASEINALEMIAFILGGAIYRGDIANEMTILNASLEEKVYERTKELEQEVIERRNTELLLKDSEEKYRHIYENANNGIILLIDNIITLINPKLSEIFQAMPKDIIGSELSSFIAPEYKELVKGYFGNNKRIYDNEEIQLQLNNSIWLEMKTTPILWDGDPAYLIFASNITKRKTAENDLKNLNENLEKRIKEEVKLVKTQQQLLVQKSKLESIGELSAGLAHEINQPLGGISMGLENILFNVNSDGLDNNYLRKKIDILFNDIDRIQKIIEHVRLFSRDQENTIIEKVNINNVIENSLGLMNKQLLGRNIDVVKILPDKIVETMGNQFRLEQVFLNILSNARHAVEEKEKRLSSENFNKRITIELSESSTYAKIAINDNGVGVDKNIILKVFDPFFTTKSEEKGTGLGLSISYGIISEMRGQIDIVSEIDCYTTMIIKLPVI